MHRAFGEEVGREHTCMMHRRPYRARSTPSQSKPMTSDWSELGCRKATGSCAEFVTICTGTGNIQGSPSPDWLRLLHPGHSNVIQVLTKCNFYLDNINIALRFQLRYTKKRYPLHQVLLIYNCSTSTAFPTSSQCLCAITSYWKISECIEEHSKTAVWSIYLFPLWAITTQLDIQRVVQLKRFLRNSLLVEAEITSIF